MPDKSGHGQPINQNQYLRIMNIPHVHVHTAKLKLI